MEDDFARREHLADPKEVKHNHATATDGSVIVPVVRDPRFAHLRPDRLSIVHISASQADKYELRMQSFLYYEKSQRINIAPGGELGIIARDVCMEVVDLGTIDLTQQQMVKLRDDISRKIGYAEPFADRAPAELLPAPASPGLDEAEPPTEPPPDQAAPSEIKPPHPPFHRPQALSAAATSAQTMVKPHPFVRRDQRGAASSRAIRHGLFQRSRGPRRGAGDRPRRRRRVVCHADFAARTSVRPIRRARFQPGRGPSRSTGCTSAAASGSQPDQRHGRTSGDTAARCAEFRPCSNARRGSAA